jgi:hypothetical protein
MRTLFAALLCFSAMARADLVIVQKVEGGGQSGEQTIRIKGDRARTDLAQQVSVISDAASGESVTLMHAPKTFLRMTAARTQALTDKMLQRRPAGPPPQLTTTGRKEKIGQFDCEIFTTNFGGVSVTYWIAAAFPNSPEILAQLAKLQAGTVSAMGRGMMPDIKDFPGVPLKTTMEMGADKVTTVLLSVKEENVDPASFEVPKNYTEVGAPASLVPR